MPYSNRELAEAFLKTGELIDALEALSRHLVDSPQDDEARRLRSDVLAHLPGEANLRAALQDLAAIQLPLSRDYIARSVLLEKLGEIDAAITAAAQGHAAFPEEDRLTERYLHLLRGQGQIAPAREIAAGLVNRQPQDWRWAQWAGDLAADAGDDTTAVTFYDAALTTLQSRHAITIDAAPLHSNPGQALTLTIVGMAVRLLLARADALFRLNQLDRADADYQTAAALIPDDPMIPFNRGLIAARRGDLATAQSWCQTAYTQASPALRERMRAVLCDDATYATVAASLAD